MASLMVLFSFNQNAYAQASATRAKPAPARAAAKPESTMVGLVTGDVDSTGTRVASDLARLLDDGTSLRVVPILGKGSYQNINDLLNMKIIDAAIVQSDVMARYQKTNKQPGIETRMQYISKLYSEEFHLLARMQMTCLQDLNGRKVSFGPKDSGMAITAEAVFEAHGIVVQPVYLDQEDGVEKLKKGEIDALVYIGGKPSRAFDRITYKDRVHFLDVEYVPQLQGAYLPAIVTAEDYPTLVAEKESVSTIAVSSVMAVHNWPPQSERYRVMARFVDRFFGEIDKLKTGGYSQKWREVNIRAPIKGWQRFQPAEKWLVANAKVETPAIPPEAAQKLKAMLQKFVESQRGNSTDQEDLFNQFVRWYQTQGTQ